MTSELEEGLIRVFLSSTFKDLEEQRKKLIERFDKGLVTIAMERFTPRGILSQQISIEDLEKSDMAIYILSPYYGSFLKECLYKDTCLHQTCGMKNNTDDISYTHCEYRYNSAQQRPHWTYILQEGCYEDNEKANEFKKEVKEYECYSSIDQKDEFIDTIINHFVNNVLAWYKSKRTNLNNFCGRREILIELNKRVSNGGVVEVLGVGGIGKTTLCEVVLLINLLLDKEVLYLGSGTRGGITTDSGYTHMSKKLDVFNEDVSLDYIIEKLKLQKIDDKSIKINSILHRLDQGKGMILYLDDFQENQDVIDLIKQGNNYLNRGCILLSAKKDMKLSSNKIYLESNEEKKRLVEILAKKANRKISIKEINEIARIAEGHPVATYLLLSNYGTIEINDVVGFKEELDLSDDKDVQEYIKRVIEGILTIKKVDKSNLDEKRLCDKTKEVLKNLALIEDELDRKSIYEAISKTYPEFKANDIILKLINTFLLKRVGDKIHWSLNQIRDALYFDEKDKHNLAINYYTIKEKYYSNRIEDSIEKLYHETKSGLSPITYVSFLFDFDLLFDLKDLVKNETNLKRLIKVGEALEVEGIKKGKVAYQIGTIYILLSQFREKRNRINKAITYFHVALDIFTKEKSNEDIAKTQNNLGTAYYTLSNFENIEENCNKAINACNESLKLISIDTTPLIYAAAQIHIGNAYLQLARVTNIDINVRKTYSNKAMEAYEDALDVYNLENEQQAYASALMNISGCYYLLAQIENKAINCKKALETIQKVLEIYTINAVPYEYAKSQNNLGRIYSTLAEMEDKKVNLKNAITAYKRALEVRTLEILPINYAETQTDLGRAYFNLASLEDKEMNCTNAIDAYQEALKIHTIDTYPLEFSTIHSYLGMTYRCLAEINHNEEYYQKAIAAYYEVLKIQTIERSPYNYANMHFHLGVLYYNLVKEKNKLEYCNKAKEAFNEAKRIYQLHNFDNYVNRAISYLGSLDKYC